MINHEKEKQEIIEMKLDNQKKQVEIVKAKKELVDSDKKLILEQLFHLRQIMTTTMFDEEKTLFPSEPKLKNVLNQEEVHKIKSKMLELIDEL